MVGTRNILAQGNAMALICALEGSSNHPYLLCRYDALTFKERKIE